MKYSIANGGTRNLCRFDKHLRLHLIRRSKRVLEVIWLRVHRL
jgi:hypothetical protein